MSVFKQRFQINTKHFFLLIDLKDFNMSRIKIDTPSHIHFQTQLTVQIGDINYGNHVSNDAFLRLAHEARLRFLQHFGYTEMNIEGCGLIMADAAIQFLQQAFHADVLNVSISVVNIGRAGFTLVYVFEREQDQQTIARIQNGMVFFDYQNQSVTPTPESFKNQFA